MHEECLICAAPLEYLQIEERLTCEICHKEVASKARCVRGHFVCDICHTSGIDALFGICLKSLSKNPFEIVEALMTLPFCHMHGPEHHVLVGASLLTAYKNAGGTLDLMFALTEMMTRGRQVPGGACGFWGACGAGISTGIAYSIITHTTPLATKTWGDANQMTSRALAAISNVGGPRCCKRNTMLALQEAIVFINETLDVNLEGVPPYCHRSLDNHQCLHQRCPFYHQ